MIADYQVITDRDSVGDLSNAVRELVLDYLAAGIDPASATIFTHSSVPALNQLLLPFLSLVTDAELRRNPTVKAEAEARRGRGLSALLFTYPVHQAADILFCHEAAEALGEVVHHGLDLLRFTDVGHPPLSVVAQAGRCVLESAGVTGDESGAVACFVEGSREWLGRCRRTHR